MLIPGQMFNNRYMIMQEIAEGGQSIVYMAQDRSAFDRLVAVKEFKMNSVALADLHAAIDQFEKTASLLAHLNHPNIAQIYEYVTLGNVPYLVTEFVNGNTLEQHLRASPNGLPEEQVKQWGAQLCDVLAYLHSQTPPIIFRDLKPDNIMLAPTGMLKLIDFGIARTFKLGRAADTELLGTPGYSPPEQYGRGQTGPYSDVYALGATLLRVATGYDPSLTPFQLSHADKVRSDISRSFSEALACSTDLDYQKRFPTMRAFRQALTSPAKPARAPNLPLAAGVLSVVALVALIVAALAATGLLSRLSPAPAVVASSPTVKAAESATEPTAETTATPAPTDTPAATNTPDSTATLAAERTKMAGDLYGTATAEVAASKPSATTPPQNTTGGPTATQEPAGPSSGPSATLAPAATTTDAKAMFSFEKPFTWQRGDQPYGEMSFSTEQAHDGSGSAKITYNFPSAENDFVVFRNNSALPAQATGMAAWVYGDKSGHFLNIWVEDSAGEVRQFSFGRIYHEGWHSMVAWFDVTLPWPQTHISGQEKNALQPPYKFYGLVLDRVSGANKGTIYVDEMNVTIQQPPAHATTPQPADTTTPAENTPAVTDQATNTPQPPPSTLTVCNPSMKGVSNMCIGNNPVPQGGSTYAIWRIETTFKEGCFDSGDGRGCVGPITSQMRVELTDISGPRTITLSWTDDELKHYTDSLTIQVSQ